MVKFTEDLEHFFNRAEEGATIVINKDDKKFVIISEESYNTMVEERFNLQKSLIAALETIDSRED